MPKQQKVSIDLFDIIFLLNLLKIYLIYSILSKLNCAHVQIIFLGLHDCE